MINMQEVIQLLCNLEADNIICREFDFKPKNIAIFIAAMASTSSEYGYIIIGASKSSKGYSINGISKSIKIDGVILAALKQLSCQPKVEFQMDTINSKNVCVIRVEKLEKEIFVSNSDNTSEQIGSNILADTLLRDIFLACVKLQRNKLFKDVSEDERNDYIRDLLETSGYHVKDQTRQGTSNTGKASGEVDILIQDKGFPTTIIEALNLSSLDTNYLNIHLDKIYKYDTLGNEYNFILSYVNVKDFETFWSKYRQHIKAHVFPYDLIGLDETLDNDYKYSDIRMLITRHNRNGRETGLYHICVKIQN
jgi:predicted HTH transcriptional regulator